MDQNKVQLFLQKSTFAYQLKWIASKIQMETWNLFLNCPVLIKALLNVVLVVLIRDLSVLKAGLQLDFNSGSMKSCYETAGIRDGAVLSRLQIKLFHRSKWK